MTRQEHEGEWVRQTLRELVEIESPSGDIDAIGRLGTALGRLLDTSDVHIERHASGHLTAVWPGHTVRQGRHILVLGHLDTVWPVGQLAEMPFVFDERTAKGPGVFDMKGALTALALAVKQVRRRGQSPTLPVRILLVADEEIGSPDGSKLVASEAERAAAVIGLEPPLPGGDLKVGRHGVARVRIAVRGVEAHSGLDRATGVSAIDELVDQLRDLHGYADARNLSINIGSVRGGTRANVVAGHAEAEVGLRYETPAEERQLFDFFAAARPHRNRAEIGVEVLSRRPAWASTDDAGLAEHVLAVAARAGVSAGTGVAGGAGDTNLTGSMGIPTVDGLGPCGAGAHAVTETVELASIIERAHILADVFTTPWPVGIGES